MLTGSTWSWWVGADSDEGTAEGLHAHGAEQVLDMPVMAIDATTVSEVERPAELKILPVTEPDEIRDYVRAYSGPPSAEQLTEVNRRFATTPLPEKRT